MGILAISLWYGISQRVMLVQSTPASHRATERDNPHIVTARRIPEKRIIVTGNRRFVPANLFFPEALDPMGKVAGCELPTIKFAAFRLAARVGIIDRAPQPPRPMLVWVIVKPIAQIRKPMRVKEIVIAEIRNHITLDKR